MADIASYAKSKANSIDTVKTTIPLAVLLAGMLSAVIGLIIWLLDGRGQGEAPGGPPSGGEPVAPETAPTRPTPSGIVPRARGDDRHPGKPTTPQVPSRN